MGMLCVACLPILIINLQIIFHMSSDNNNSMDSSYQPQTSEAYKFQWRVSILRKHICMSVFRSQCHSSEVPHMFHHYWHHFQPNHIPKSWTHNIIHIHNLQFARNICIQHDLHESLPQILCISWVLIAHRHKQTNTHTTLASRRKWTHMNRRKNKNFFVRI